MNKNSEDACLRRKIYEIIDSPSHSLPHRIYSGIIMAAVIISLIPLAFKEDYLLFYITDKITVGIFIIDYILRILVADIKLHKKGIKAFLTYPLKPLAVIDLLSILPSITPLHSTLKILKMVKFLKALRAIRLFRFIRYSKSVRIIRHVFRDQGKLLIMVGGIAAAYIGVTALILFNVEPETFPSFFDAIYCATVSLTPIGYGNIYPVSVIGRLVTMISSVAGLGIIALPTGIITAGCLHEINRHRIED